MKPQEGKSYWLRNGSLVHVSCVGETFCTVIVAGGPSRRRHRIIPLWQWLELRAVEVA